MKKFLVASVIALASTVVIGQEAYPSKPIRIIVPYNAGGAGDVMARTLGNVLGKQLKQSVIVENRPGGTGMIGTTLVARAKGDPYTLLMGASAEIAINPSLYQRINYSPEKDLVPISFVGKLPLVLVANPAVPAKNLSELIQVARQKPDFFAFGSAGVGQPAHLGLELMMKETGARMLHVPYKGGSEAIMAVMGDQIQLFLSGLPPAIDQIKAGKLKPLAVSTADRVPQMQEVPTFTESGVSNVDIYNWFAIFAPAGVPDEVVKVLNEEINKALTSDQVKKVWEAQGIYQIPMTPQELNKFVGDETRKYQRLIETTQVKVD